VSRRRTKKIVHKTEFLREEFFETKEIHDKAKLDFFSKIKTIQSELNVYDADLDAGYQHDPAASKKTESGSTNSEGTNCEDDVPDDSETANILKHPAWVKSVYRKITIKTHPDKLILEETEERERKEKLYAEAASAYSEGDYASLIMIAIDLNLSLPDNGDIVDILSKKCDQYTKDTKVLKLSLFWTWHHSDDSQKQEILRRFVKEKGWTDPGAAIKKSRSDRHPGQSVAWIRKKLADAPEDV